MIASEESGFALKHVMELLMILQVRCCSQKREEIVSFANMLLIRRPVRIQPNLVFCKVRGLGFEALIWPMYMRLQKISVYQDINF